MLRLLLVLVAIVAVMGGGMRATVGVSRVIWVILILLALWAGISWIAHDFRHINRHGAAWWVCLAAGASLIKNIYLTGVLILVATMLGLFVSLLLAKLFVTEDEWDESLGEKKSDRYGID